MLFFLTKTIIDDFLHFIQILVEYRKIRTFGDSILYDMASSSSFGVTQMIIMKAILTLFFVLTLGTVAQAHETKKIEAVETEVVLLTSIETVEEVEITTENNVARLYKFKNSRIKKALSFRTKRNRAKMA